MFFSLTRKINIKSLTSQQIFFKSYNYIKSNKSFVRRKYMLPHDLIRLMTNYDVEKHIKIKNILIELLLADIYAIIMAFNFGRYITDSFQEDYVANHVMYAMNDLTKFKCNTFLSVYINIELSHNRIRANKFKEFYIHDNFLMFTYYDYFTINIKKRKKTNFSIKKLIDYLTNNSEFIEQRYKTSLNSVIHDKKILLEFLLQIFNHVKTKYLDQIDTFDIKNGYYITLNIDMIMFIPSSDSLILVRLESINPLGIMEDTLSYVFLMTKKHDFYCVKTKNGIKNVLVNDEYISKVKSEIKTLIFKSTKYLSNFKNRII